MFCQLLMRPQERENLSAITSATAFTAAAIKKTNIT